AKARAMELALVDASPTGLVRQRYEADATREFHRCLTQLTKLRTTAVIRPSAPARNEANSAATDDQSTTSAAPPASQPSASAPPPPAAAGPAAAGTSAVGAPARNEANSAASPSRNGSSADGSAPPPVSVRPGLAPAERAAALRGPWPLA